MSSSGSSGGITLSGALLMIFIVLKLCGVIDWSWLWVLSPLWISAGIAVLIIVGMLIYWKIEEHKN